MARVLYQDPDVLILDEFTNSLDPENEDFILEQLQLLKKEKNKNFFIITHKMKPLRLCDQIIVLEEGKILQKFSFEEFNKNLVLFMNNFLFSKICLFVYYKFKFLFKKY